MKYLDALFGLFWQKFCPNCLEAEVMICKKCSLEFSELIEVKNAERDIVDFDLLSTAKYQGLVRSLILAWKDHGRQDLFSVLKIPLKSAVETVSEKLEENIDEIIVIPAPSTRSSMNRRGRQQTLEIAKYVAKEFENRSVKANVKNALSKRNQSKQVKMGASSRIQKSSGSIKVKVFQKKSLQNKKCVIIDDIATTGATIAEIGSVVKNHGGKVIAAIVLAAT